MRHLPGSKIVFITAFLLVVFVNAIILIGAGYNRSGDPESVVVLTERELQTPYRWNKDESALRIHWRILLPEHDKYNRYNSPLWFDQQKLESLGYEFHQDSDNDDNSQSLEYATMKRQSNFIEREVILVLEYDGDTYQQAVKLADKKIKKIERKLAKLTNDKELLIELKEAKEYLKHEQLSASRLFVIDAGLDVKALRRQYPNNQRFILANGIVDASSYWPYKNNEEGFIAGRIDRLSVERLHVERDAHSIIDKLRPSLGYAHNENPPRFQAIVHYGQRLEPWIDSVSRAK